MNSGGSVHHHLPVWWPMSSRNAAGWSGHSRLCCPSAGSPPEGATERFSVEHAPSCSEPETMATAQRRQLYVSWGGYIQSALTSSHTHLCLHALGCSHNSQIISICKQTGVNLRTFKLWVGFRLESANADKIYHAYIVKKYAILTLQPFLVCNCLRREVSL